MELEKNISSKSKKIKNSTKEIFFSRKLFFLKSKIYTYKKKKKRLFAGFPAKLVSKLRDVVLVRNIVVV